MRNNEGSAAGGEGCEREDSGASRKGIRRAHEGDVGENTDGITYPQRAQLKSPRPSKISGALSSDPMQKINVVVIAQSEAERNGGNGGTRWVHARGR